MSALIILTLVAAIFAIRALLKQRERAKRFERRMHLEAWLDGRLAHRKAQRQVRSERAKRGWNTRRAV